MPLWGCVAVVVAGDRVDGEVFVLASAEEASDLGSFCLDSVADPFRLVAWGVGAAVDGFGAVGAEGGPLARGVEAGLRGA